MGRIKLLNQLTANGIAAGEVVERPASVVKELVENALDAGASVITVEITDGGIRMIRVTDNGCGMDEEDASAAFECHATSKITSLDDLENLSTMGFRGEALSSIAAVSMISLKTRQVGDEYGTKVELEAGKPIRRERHAGVWGTTIEVRNLFFNVPARYKFLKKDQTEAQYVTILCERFALIRPDVSFRLLKNDKEILHTPGNNDPRSALYCVYGGDVVDSCVPIDSSNEQIKVRGFAGKPVLARSGRGEQTIFVNDRIIRSKTISAAIDEAYKTLLMRGKFAFVVLMIYVPPALIDVNVHPQKAEVRFWNDSEIFRSVYHALQSAMMNESLIPDALTGSEGFVSRSSHSGAPMNRIENETQNTDDPSMTSPERRDVAEPTKAEDIYPSWPDKTKQSGDYVDQYAYAQRQNVLFSDSSDPNILIQQTYYPRDEMQTDRIQAVLGNARDREIALSDIKNARYIGTLFNTYILLESKDNLIVLDQHAAHEKVLYEKLLKEDSSRDRLNIPSQQLITPPVVTLTASDSDFVDENRNKYLGLGFDFDRVGPREIAIRYAPSFLPEKSITAVFIDMTETLKSETDASDEKYLLAMATAACKAAVKAHDRLDPQEIRALIDSLTILDNPFSCPHGRPVIVRFSRKVIEKEFKRIL